MFKKIIVGFVIITSSLFLVSCTKNRELVHTPYKSNETYKFEEFFKIKTLSDFRFSSDGNNLYFLKSDGNVKNIFSYDITRKETTQVTRFKEPVVDYTLSPQNDFILLRQDSGGNQKYDIFKYHISTGEKQNLTENNNKERSDLCHLSDDGEIFYYSQTWDDEKGLKINKINLQSLEVTTILKEKNKYFSCETVNDKSQVLVFEKFITNNEVNIGYINLLNNNMFYIDKSKGVKNRTPQITPVGILYTSNKISDVSALWKFDFETKKSFKIKLSEKGDIEKIRSYDDGHRVAVYYRDKYKTEVKVFTENFKKEIKLVIPNKDISNIYFSRTKPNLGVITQAGNYPERYIIFNGSSNYQFYDANQSIVKEEYFARIESKYVPSFDALNIPTNFYIPPDASEINKMPVILFIHGGPEDHDDPEFSALLNFFTNHGFIAVLPNVRGSSGFGKKYSFMDNGDWGGAHIKDIISVAEYSKSLNYTDPNNLFIIGGSFGGFSVLSAITQYPYVFNAAVEQFGVSELSSFIGSAPVYARSYWLSELGSDPRVDAEFNQKISPLYNIEKIKIPLQIHQGKNDPIVTIDQSDIIANKLKSLSLPVEYYIYPNEGHGFSKFDNVKSSYTRALEFFKKNITVEPPERVLLKRSDNAQ